MKWQYSQHGFCDFSFVEGKLFCLAFDPQKVEFDPFCVALEVFLDAPDVYYADDDVKSAPSPQITASWPQLGTVYVVGGWPDGRGGMDEALEVVQQGMQLRIPRNPYRKES